MQVRAQRLKIETNIILELIQQRSNRSDINFKDIMQADFVLYLRDELLKLNGRWFPFSLLNFPNQPFEMFSRSKSIKFFNDFKKTIGIERKEELGKFFDEYDKDQFKQIKLGYFHKLEPQVLANFERLATVE